MYIKFVSMVMLETLYYWWLIIVNKTKKLTTELSYFITTRSQKERGLQVFNIFFHHVAFPRFVKQNNIFKLYISGWTKFIGKAWPCKVNIETIVSTFWRIVNIWSTGQGQVRRVLATYMSQRYILAGMVGEWKKVFVLFVFLQLECIL